MFLTENFVEVSHKNWFVAFESIIESLKKQITDNCIVLTAAGMGSKVLIAELLKTNPTISCIDIGSSFDFLCQMKNTRNRTHTYDEIYNYYKDLLPNIIKDSKRVLQNDIITNKYCIVKEEFEPTRYNRLVELFKSINWDVEFICPTYKHTITQEIYDKYVLTDAIFNLRSSPIKKADVSLNLNFLEVLRTIRKNYSSGIFLTLESDIYLYGDIEDLHKIIKVASKNNTFWDCIHFGYDKPNVATEFDIFEDGIGLVRKYNPRCTDSLIWSYNGVIKYLDYLENKIKLDFSIPIDYIFWDLLKSNKDFYFYWSNPVVFIQGSNAGLEKSTIQNDTS